MKRALVIAALALSACGGTGTMHGGYEAYLAKKGVTAPVTSEKFPHCHGYGCRHVVNVKLSKAGWRAIEKPFKKVKTAADERAAIAVAVAQFEKTVGALTGTDEDRAGTYATVGIYQHDCVDESVNTTIYLALLEQRGTLKFHTAGTPTARTLFTSGSLGPHQTAVIRETATDNAFAVDSWFHDNGTPPEIVPLRDWISGWRP